jgi:mannose-6-phosphate isomerase-like protein (cupin superfamily)
MDELNKALDIALTGPEKQQALEAFEKQMRDWNVVMPATERLVLDFGLGTFATVGLIECWIANELDAGYCGKFLFVFDGQTCPMHQHQTKHETFYIVRGQVKMHFDGSDRVMNAGDVLPVDAGKLHSFTGAGPALLLEISKPCIVEDNFFQNTAIPIGGNYRK